MEAFVLRLERSSNERNAPSPHKPPSASARSSSPSLGVLGFTPVSRFAQPRAALPPLHVLARGGAKLQSNSSIRLLLCRRAARGAILSSHGSTSRAREDATITPRRRTKGLR
jgi:hypothetical protein|eukprot:COSAG06_NODE_15336_length_1079_cov_1.018367_2_plen_112_part_00